MNITIKKAAIRGSLFLNYEFEQTDTDVKNLIKTNSDAPIHDDLRWKFKQMIPHFALICEQITDEDLIKKIIENPSHYLADRDSSIDQTLFDYRVTEFQIIEKDGEEKIKLFGFRQLKSFAEISFSTPSISLSDSEYPFITELNDLIEETKKEILAYMQGKTAPKAQMEMFSDDDDDEFSN